MLIDQRRLFWTERIGFLIMAITYSLEESLSYNLYIECVAYFKLFWKCTTILYSFSYAAKIFFQSPFTKSVQDGIGIGVILGFLLERISLYIWAYNSESLHSVQGWYVQSCFVMIFPLLNIYSAFMCGNSMKSLPNPDNDDSTRTAVIELHKQENSSTERVVFWVERLGLLVLSLSWCFWNKIVEIVSRDSFHECMTKGQFMFWICTNTVYLHKYFEKKGKVSISSKFKNHPGFWLERLALFGYAIALALFLHSSHYFTLMMMLELYFTVFFPMLNIYYAWFGYSKEFQP